MLEQADARGLGLSAFVSIGNKADVSSNDLLEYWEDDPETDVVLLYLESFGNPRKFARVAGRVARSKPILAMRSGTSRAGARAASSHTAALAGSDGAVEALFWQAGVIRARTLEELLEDPHLKATGFFTEREHPTEGPIVTFASPLDFEKTKVEYRHHAPRIGEDGEAILREAGMSAAAIEKLKADKTLIMPS